MAPLVKLVSCRQDPAQLDLVLMRSVARGDQKAFRRLHDRYYFRAYKFALRLVQKPDLAENVANDAMLAVWKGAGKFEERAKVSTWIFGIVYRQAQKTRWTFRFERFQDDISERHDLEDQGTETVEAFFERRRVRTALTKLPMQLRAVVELTYYDGLSYSEISQIMDCAEGTVKSRMSRARDSLRKMLNEET